MVNGGKYKNKYLNKQVKVMTEVKKLAAMIDLVEQLNRSDWNVKTAAENDQYIRVNGGTFRAVSLADKSALCGFAKQGAKDIETIKNHFKNNQPQNLANDVFEAKKERRLQSRIIKKALLNQRNLLHESLFGAALKDHFDKLLFAFDEVSFEKNRVDLIAVGKKENKIFPVVIELKSNRSLTRLVEQLNDASDAILKNLAEIKTLLKL
jgi:hypothetical protein